MKIKGMLCIMALMLCMGAFCSPVFASDGGDETLTVNAAWVDGELMRIDVTDVNGVNSSLALHLSDYIKKTDNSEFISIQAVDLAGNKSGVIEIKNPYYTPPTADASTPPTASTSPKPSETTPSEIPSGNKPFTPNGNGTVVDNASEENGKEFFTIKTEDENVFYLIVDRQKTGENVYLLNAVTEDDLAALAQKGSKSSSKGTSTIPTPKPNTEEEKQAPTATPGPETKVPEKSSNNNSIIFVVFAIVAVGGAGYYFKVVKVKKDASDHEEDDNEGEYEFEDDPEQSDDDGEDYEFEDKEGDE